MGNLYQIITSLLEVREFVKTVSHILIVESEPAYLDVLKQLFTPIASQVTTTISVESAFDVMDKASNGVPAPNILFLDWADPKEGAMLLRRWVASKKSPVCVLTAINKEATEALHIQGAYNAFQKPVDVSVIASVARNYVKMVNDTQAIEQLRIEIKSHKRVTYLLIAVAFILSGGPNFLTFIKTFLP